MKIMLGMLVLAASMATADEVPVPPPVWSGQAALSYLAMTGNTSNSTLGASGKAVYQPGPYTAKLSLGYIHTRNDGATTSKRSEASLWGERTVFPRLSVTAQSWYYRDVFAGIYSQRAVDAGGRYRLRKDDHISLSVLVSLARIWEDHSTDPPHNFLGSRLSSDFSIAFNDSVKMSQEMSYTRDFSIAANWRIQSTTAFTAAVHQYLALEFSHKLYHVNLPNPGKRRTDSTILASVVAAWPVPEKK